MEYKICVTCCEEKEITAFPRAGGAGQYHTNKCGQCIRVWNKLPAETRELFKREKIEQIRHRSHKHCANCDTEKPRREFYKLAASLDGMAGNCKKCTDKRKSNASKRWRRDRKEVDSSVTHNTCRVCAETKEICEFNKNSHMKSGYENECKKCKSIRFLKYGTNAENRKRWLLQRIRTKCDSIGIEFNLTIEDLVIPDVCPVLGLKLKFGADRAYGNNATDDSPSVDRIDPTKGYTKDNIVIVSWRANRIKGNASFDELKKISNFYNEENMYNIFNVKATFAQQAH